MTMVGHSALDLGAAVLCALSLAALGGWLAGGCVYFLGRAEARAWRRLRAAQRYSIGLIGGLALIASIPFAPIVLISGYSAWWRHRAREIKRDKIAGALRSIGSIRAAAQGQEAKQA